MRFGGPRARLARVMEHGVRERCVITARRLHRNAHHTTAAVSQTQMRHSAPHRATRHTTQAGQQQALAGFQGRD